MMPIRTALIVSTLMLSTLPLTTPSQAASPRHQAQEMTAGTILHQSGWHAPIRTRHISPLQQDPASTSGLRLPRVKEQSKTLSSTPAEVETGELIRYWGQRI